MKRFIWVFGPNSQAIHIKFGSTKSEGVTKCGIPVRKGWLWFRNRRPWDRVCKRCEVA